MRLLAARAALVFLFLASLLALASGDNADAVIPIPPLTYTVDTPADNPASPNCSPGGHLARSCSLREAINEANGHISVGQDTIAFGIAPGSIIKISPTSELPEITDPVDIDGTTQYGGCGGLPCIELDGSLAGNASGILIGAGGVTIRGLAIGKFNQNAISVIGGSNDTIAGNFIGTLDGSTAAGNTTGIRIGGSVSQVTIGGTTAAQRNVISASFSNIANGANVFIDGSQNLIEGNYIGTNSAGSVAIANYQTAGVVVNGSDNTIGGTQAGAGDVISGNDQAQVQLAGGSGNQVLGNLIGTDATGANGLGGTFCCGVEIGNSTNDVIGGTESRARNVISNNGVGVWFTGASSAGGNQVSGNYIGTNAAGTAAILNCDGIDLIPFAPLKADGNAIFDNVISGNTTCGNATGIEVAAPPGSEANNNQIYGNIVGLNAAGTAAIPNQTGISIYSLGGAVQGNVIGGAGNAPNVISGNQYGLSIEDAGTANNVVDGNLIGTDLSGAVPLGNTRGGVFINRGAASNLVERNVISANGGSLGELGPGVFIGDSGTDENELALNYIGTNKDGATSLGNAGAGVTIKSGPQHTLIGSETAPASADGTEPQAAAAGGNVIRNNGGPGVIIDQANSVNNTVSGNSIDNNGGLGIALTNGANMGQTAPVVTSAFVQSGTTEIRGTLTSTPSVDFTIEFFASPSCDPSGAGEGRDFLGAVLVTTDAGGTAPIDHTVSANVTGQSITATATFQNGATSQFSTCVTATGPTPTPSPTPLPTHSPTPTPTISPSGLRGDANCDGHVSTEDVSAMLTLIAGVPPGAQCSALADLNCNGRSDAEDALRILAYVAGAPLTQPHSCAGIG